jgi:hypothetical protein
MSQELNKLLENPLIAQTKLDYIKSEFIDFTSVAEEWKEKDRIIKSKFKIAKCS